MPRSRYTPANHCQNLLQQCVSCLKKWCVSLPTLGCPGTADSSLFRKKLVPKWFAELVEFSHQDIVVVRQLHVHRTVVEVFKETCLVAHALFVMLTRVRRQGTWISGTPHMAVDSFTHSGLSLLFFPLKWLLESLNWCQPLEMTSVECNWMQCSLSVRVM